MKIAGIVLAGGLSTRMGTDKAQLLLAKQPLLMRTVTLLESINLERVFVSGQYPGFSSIEDLHPNLGPIGGIDACVNHLSGLYDALFILPVDMPLLSELECQQLIAKFYHYPQGVFFESATFPMILPLNTELKSYLSEVLLSPHKKHRSLYRLLKILKIQPVNYQQQQAFRFQNSNTPEEWGCCVETYTSLQTDVNSGK